jgi:uncharacterized protein
MSEIPVLLFPIFFGVAFLHSSVGLAGGSSYTAIMAVFGVPIQIIPSISLSLNTLVSSVGGFNFIRYRHFHWQILAPFLVGSIPAVYIGAKIILPTLWFYFVLLITLLLGVVRLLFWRNYTNTIGFSNIQRYTISTVLGAVLGFISGSVGIGGGVYLVPSILLLGFADAKKAAACGIVFIWVNSVIGLLSKWQSNMLELSWILPMLLVVFCGGFAGSLIGAKLWSSRYLENILIFVMSIACLLLTNKIWGLF